MAPIKPGFVRVEDVFADAVTSKVRGRRRSGLFRGERGLVVNPRFVRVSYPDEVKRDFVPNVLVERAEREQVKRELIASLGFCPPLIRRRKSKRCKVEQRVRHKVFMRDAYTCQICGWEADPNDKPDERGRWNGRRHLTVDHIIPASLGGPNAQWNLRAACCDCNQESGRLIPKLSDFVVLPPGAPLPQAA